MTQTHSQPKTRSSKWSVIILILGILALLAAGALYYESQQEEEVEVLTRDGVVTQIKELSRLQTVAYSVDTVITIKKQGNWYSLLNYEDKGLFVAHGRVTAGIDLGELNADNVIVTPRIMDEQGNPHVTSDADLQIDITLPAAQIFDVYLDDIEVYDLQSGLFGMMKTDPSMFELAQESGKDEVLTMACKGEVLQMATDNAQKQVEGLFKLTGAAVTVTVQPPANCMETLKTVENPSTSATDS